MGSWNALERHNKADQEGNIIQGKSITVDAHNNIIVNDNGHLTALIGVDDLIIVHTPEATLVCPKSKSQEIKKIVHEIAQHPELESLI